MRKFGPSITNLHSHSRYKEMVDKNEKTKALIRMRDDARDAKHKKLLDESTHITSLYMAQRTRAMDYCTAKGNFGTVNNA